MSPRGNIWTASATTSSSRLFTWTMTDYKADRQKDRHTDRQTDRQKTNTQIDRHRWTVRETERESLEVSTCKFLGKLVLFHSNWYL